MVKVKVLSRVTTDHTREVTGERMRMNKNADPTLHPFEREREYVRALNATKLDKVFAKPFLGALSGHYDGVYCMAKHPSSLSTIVSGDMSGEIRSWSLASQKCSGVIQAHEGFVTGLTFCSATRILSSSQDRTVKEWDYPFNAAITTSSDYDLEGERGSNVSGAGSHTPAATYLCKNPVNNVDAQHFAASTLFATAAGSNVSIWDRTHYTGASGTSEPIREFEWGTETVHHVRFNPIEPHILAASAGDRSIALYDVRQSTPLHKVILKMKTNCISWNPIEAYHFVTANDDFKLYSFDMRRLGAAMHVHGGHTGAVLSVDFAPTGREFVSGSFDNTIRIWPFDEMRSRDVYHTKRMQRIMCVAYSDDARFVLSGSDDANVRVWKARASEPIKILSNREKEKLDYGDKLKKRFAEAPEIRRIANYHRVPKAVLVAHRKEVFARNLEKTKLNNMIKHSKKGTVKVIPIKRKPIVTEQN